MIDVWLYGTHIARIDGRRPRLSYTDAAIARWGGQQILSLSHFVGSQSIPPGLTKALMESWLPEGDALRELHSTFGTAKPEELLAEIGQESVGAVTVVPSGVSPVMDEAPNPVPLDSFQVADRLRSLPRNPLGVASDNEVRLSLAGFQPKLLLVRDEDDRLCDPLGSPSNVIIKPVTSFDDIVPLELYGLEVAQATGVPVAQARAETFDGVEALVLERFDRHRLDDGRLERIHQEDLCAGLGQPPNAKYATTTRSPTTLAHMARLLYENTEDAELSIKRFLTLVIVNILIGNCDAHARNYSVLIDEQGAVEFSPAYDLVPTIHYPQLTRRMSQPVSDVLNIDKVTESKLREEIESWGMAAAHDLLDTALDDAKSAVRDIKPASSRIAEYQKSHPLLSRAR